MRGRCRSRHTFKMFCPRYSNCYKSLNGINLKAGSHVRRKRKHKEVHTSNANASTVQYASAIGYCKMVDEVDVLALLFFLFLGLRRIRRRRLIQRNNKSRPKRGFEKSFEKDNFFLSCRSTYRFEDQLLKLRQPQFNLFLKITATFVEKNRIFPNFLERVFFTLRKKCSRKKCKRKRKEMKNFPFLASALVLAFAFAFASW